MARLLLWAACGCVGGPVRAVWSRHEPSQERVTPEGIGQVDEKRVDLTYPLGRDKSCGTTRDGTTPPEPRVSSKDCSASPSRSPRLRPRLGRSASPSRWLLGQ